MSANRYPIAYTAFENGMVPLEAGERLRLTPELARPLDDPSLTDQPTMYRDVALRLWETPYNDSATYGELLAAQDLRYAGHFGKGYDRKLMAIEFGPDADPVGHNVLTFRFTASLNAGEVAFWLQEKSIDVSPIDDIPDTLNRLKNCAGMALEVSRSTARDLEQYKGSFRIVQEALEDHRELLRRIEEELPRLIAA